MVPLVQHGDGHGQAHGEADMEENLKSSRNARPGNSHLRCSGVLGRKEKPEQFYWALYVFHNLLRAVEDDFRNLGERRTVVRDVVLLR